ncbi:MAG: YceH family protein [Rhodoferax sp.]|nr:YceH family protein [Rhodoferax sp.]
MTNPLCLSLAETRVLGTLMEKARTVPDSYPMTLNTLMAGCNQKTSRYPLLDLTEGDVNAALQTLMANGLVHPVDGGRVTRYAHNAQRGIGVPEQSTVLLGLLMLRGPQTAAELRANAERWYRFADTSSVEAFLEELQDRSPEKGGALVRKMDRSLGAREHRWIQLLSAPHTDPTMPTEHPAAADAPAQTDLASRLTKLEAEVEDLRFMVTRLHQELGIPQPAN